MGRFCPYYFPAWRFFRTPLYKKISLHCNFSPVKVLFSIFWLSTLLKYFLGWAGSWLGFLLCSNRGRLISGRYYPQIFGVRQSLARFHPLTSGSKMRRGEEDTPQRHRVATNHLNVILHAMITKWTMISQNYHSSYAELNAQAHLILFNTIKKTQNQSKPKPKPVLTQNRFSIMINTFFTLNIPFWPIWMPLSYFNNQSSKSSPNQGQDSRQKSCSRLDYKRLLSSPTSRNRHRVICRQHPSSTSISCVYM